MTGSFMLSGGKAVIRILITPNLNIKKTQFPEKSPYTKI